MEDGLARSLDAGEQRKCATLPSGLAPPTKPLTAKQPQPATRHSDWFPSGLVASKYPMMWQGIAVGGLRVALLSGGHSY